MGRTQGSGTGSIYKRGDKWRGQITVNGRRMSYTSAKKKDVIDWIAEVRSDPNIPKPKNITVEELGNQWLEKVKKPTLTPQSYYLLEHQFTGHLYPYLGDRQVQHLTKDEIETFYQKSFQGNFSPKTIDNFRKRFKSLLEYAVEENIILVNPHSKAIVRKPKTVSKVQAYTEAEQAKIIKYLKANQTTENILFYLLLTTGMRVSEACALQWSDVDFKEKSVNITKSVVHADGYNKIQSHPKTASSVRKVYVTETQVKVLKVCRQTFNQESSQIFTQNGGTIFTSKYLRPRWQKICAELGIPYYGIHCLRHTFATRALEKGVDIKTVSAILGHKSVVTTMNLYQHVYSAQKLKAMDMMKDLF